MSPSASSCSSLASFFVSLVFSPATTLTKSAVKLWQMMTLAPESFTEESARVIDLMERTAVVVWEGV